MHSRVSFIAPATTSNPLEYTPPGGWVVGYRSWRIEEIYYTTPSCSPGSLLTRFCSQSSRSFAASLCAASLACSHIRMQEVKTHIIFLFHINPPSCLANPQLILLAHPLDSSIMLLISDSCRGREEERACHHGCYKWKPEECEGVLGQC